MNALLELSEPINATVSAQQSSIAHRDDVLATAKCIVSVTTQAELEIAVAALKELTAITKETEAARTTVKAPIIALGKKIDDVAKSHVAPVEPEKVRITNLVNGYQRKQLEEQQRREREARAEAEKAQREAAEAQRRIEEQEREAQRQRLIAEQASGKAKAAALAAAQKAEDEKLNAQLAAEEAALSKQSAEMTLTAPTNTPRGLTTRTRFDFEITNPFTLAAKHPELWTWHAGTETLKFDRAGFLKALNNEATPHQLLPNETQQSVVHANLGVRIYRDVSTHVRA